MFERIVVVNGKIDLGTENSVVGASEPYPACYDVMPRMCMDIHPKTDMYKRCFLFLWGYLKSRVNA